MRNATYEYEPINKFRESQGSPFGDRKMIFLKLLPFSFLQQTSFSFLLFKVSAIGLGWESHKSNKGLLQL